MTAIENNSTKAEIDQALGDTGKNNEGVAEPMAIIRAAINADEGYAWSWHCNLTMAFYDSWTNENRPADIHRKANEGAARFMRLLFGIDMTTFKEYQDAAAEWKDIPETVAMSPVATYDGVEFTRYTLGWMNGAMPEGTVLYAPTAEVQAKRLTTEQMLSSIATADQVQEKNEQLLPVGEVHEVLSQPGTDGREQA